MKGERGNIGKGKRGDLDHKGGKEGKGGNEKCR